MTLNEALCNVEGQTDGRESINTAPSGDGGQIILYLGGLQDTKTLLITHGNLDVVLRHLTLETLLQCENGCVHRIFQLQLVVVPSRNRKQEHKIGPNPIEWKKLHKFALHRLQKGKTQ